MDDNNITQDCLDFVNDFSYNDNTIMIIASSFLVLTLTLYSIKKIQFILKSF